MHAATELTSLTLDAHLVTGGAPATSFARLWRSLWSQPYLTPELLEMCRLTLARLHQDEWEAAALNPHLPAGALSAERRQLLLAGRVFRSAAFSDAEKAVLLFAECYALDPQSIADAVADDVKNHLGEAGLVFLIEALGCLDGRIRSARCLRDLARFSAPQAGNHVG